jgi:hypothetical protein
MKAQYRSWSFVAAVALVLALLPVPALAQSGGIKGGFLYSTLKFDEADDVFDSHTGWTAGIFFGSAKDRSVGIQGELNVLQKGGNDGLVDVRLYYLQVPVLARVSAGGAVRVFGTVGPAFDIKIAEKEDELALVQDWEGIDVGFMAGGGFEFGMLIVEARGTWGLRNIAKSVVFFEGEKLTSKTFAIQAGIRFK